MAPSKKATAKKATAKKATAKKATAKKTAKKTASKTTKKTARKITKNTSKNTAKNTADKTADKTTVETTVKRRRNKSCDASPFLKSMIVGAREHGLRFREISTRFDIPISTVTSICYRAEREAQGLIRKRTGRKTKLTEREQRLILQRVAKDPNTSAVKIQAELDIDVTSGTICKFLKSKNVYTTSMCRADSAKSQKAAEEKASAEK